MTAEFGGAVFIGYALSASVTATAGFSGSDALQTGWGVVEPGMERKMRAVYAHWPLGDNQPAMINRLAYAAHELDAWLHQHVGRAYIAILSWGLVVSILGSLRILGHAFSAGGIGLSTILVLIFQAALLVNQLAQWHDLRARRRPKDAQGLSSWKAKKEEEFEADEHR